MRDNIYDEFADIPTDQITCSQWCKLLNYESPSFSDNPSIAQLQEELANLMARLHLSFDIDSRHDKRHEQQEDVIGSDGLLGLFHKAISETYGERGAAVVFDDSDQTIIEDVKEPSEEEISRNIILDEQIPNFVVTLSEVVDDILNFADEVQRQELNKILQSVVDRPPTNVAEALSKEEKLQGLFQQIQAAANKTFKAKWGL